MLSMNVTILSCLRVSKMIKLSARCGVWYQPRYNSNTVHCRPHHVMCDDLEPASRRDVTRLRQMSLVVRTVATSANDRLYCDRFYPAQRIADLTRDIRFDDDVTLSVDYAREWEVTSLLPAMLQSAAERGDNVGIDEFKGHRIQELTEYATIFRARLKQIDGDSSTAFLVIRPPDYSRTQDPSLAEIHVIRSRDLSDVTYAGLVKLSVELTKQLDVGYMDSVMSVSASCASLVRVLTSQLDFRIVATLPRSVNMANGVGLTDSILLVHSITPDDYRRQPRSDAEVLSMLAKHGIADGVEDDAANNKATLPSIAFLPQQYFCRRANLQLKIRNIERHKDRLAYELFVATRNRGEGISLHDLPCLAMFRKYHILKGPCAIIEDSSNGLVVGWYYFSYTPFARSPAARSAETALILDKSYQNRGIGGDTVGLFHGMAKQLDYVSTFNDYFANNTRSKRVNSLPYQHVLGTLPRAAYVAGKGWQDQVVISADLLADHSDLKQPLFD